MKSFFSIFLLTILICFSQAAIGQDFGQLLSAVDKLEASLKQMVETEQGQRQEAIDNLAAEVKLLKAEIDALKSQPLGSADASNHNQQLAGLKSGMNQLAKENLILLKNQEEQARIIAGLQTQVASGATASGQGVSPYYTQQLASLSMQIIELKSELHRYQAAGSRDIATPGPVSVNLPISKAREKTGLRISGYFDVQATHKSSASDHTQFGLGQVKIVLKHDLSKMTRVTIVPMWKSSGVLSLGPAHVRQHLMGYDNSPITELSLTVGKLNAAFGIGRLEIGSVSRKIPTCPKAISLTHNYWGDYGVEFNLKFAFGNFAAYAVNGFASTAEVDSAMSLSLGIPEGSVINTTPAYAFGTRIGMTPISSLECGMSFASGHNKSNRNEMMMVGADLQYSIFLFDFKGEYIYHSLNRSINERNNRAYYFESRFSTGRWTAASRFGSFKPDGQNWDGRFAIAAGFGISKNVEVKVESLFNEDTDRNASTVQLVTRF